MRQRLCLAHALVHDPQILLLDEPASGLDPRARVEMRELLRELRAMGKTIVLSSHILSELAELCDAVGIIEKGLLVTSGPLEDIRKHLQNRHILRIKILSDLQTARDHLHAHPMVKQVSPANGSPQTLEVEFMGDESAAADLLDSLIEHKIRVVSFSEKNIDLEEIFLRLTKGEVT